MRETIQNAMALPPMAARLALVSGLVVGLAAGPAFTQEPAEEPTAEPAAEVATSADWVIEVDPAQSSITFELGATLHTVEGTAEVTGGRIRFDPSSGGASGRIEVDATSLDTGNENRDEDMHEKVLESTEYPEIYFRAESASGSFEPEGESRVTLGGVFGIHGDEHPVSLEFDVVGEGDTVRASTQFRVPYVEWGMKDPSKFLLRVEKHVTVRIDAVGTLSRPEPESGAAEAAEGADGAAADG